LLLIIILIINGYDKTPEGDLRTIPDTITNGTVIQNNDPNLNSLINSPINSPTAIISQSNSQLHTQSNNLTVIPKSSPQITLNNQDTLNEISRGNSILVEPVVSPSFGYQPGESYYRVRNYREQENVFSF